MSASRGSRDFKHSEDVIKLITSHNALIKVIESKIDEDKNWDFILKQLADPVVNRPIKELKAECDRTIIYDAADGKDYKRDHLGIRGAPKNTIYTKKTATSLLPRNGKMITFNSNGYNVGLIFNLNDCLVKPKYVFAGNQMTNCAWWLRGQPGWENRQETRAVPIDTIRVNQNIAITLDQKIYWNEILAKLTKKSVVGVFAPKNTVTHGLNAILKKIMIEEALNKQIDILIITPDQGFRIYQLTEQFADMETALKGNLEIAYLFAVKIINKLIQLKKFHELNHAAVNTTISKFISQTDIPLTEDLLKSNFIYHLIEIGAIKLINCFSFYETYPSRVEFLIKKHIDCLDGHHLSLIINQLFKPTQGYAQDFNNNFLIWFFENDLHKKMNRENFFPLHLVLSNPNPCAPLIKIILNKYSITWCAKNQFNQTPLELLNISNISHLNWWKNKLVDISPYTLINCLFSRSIKQREFAFSKELLKEYHQIDVDYTNSDSPLSPITELAHADNFSEEGMRLLLKHQASITKPNRVAENFITICFKKNKINFIQDLIINFLDLIPKNDVDYIIKKFEEKNQEGLTVFEKLLSQKEFKVFDNLFPLVENQLKEPDLLKWIFSGIKHGHNDFVIAKLFQKNIIFDIKNDLRFLHEAVIHCKDNFSLIDWLCNQGANLYKKNNNGESALTLVIDKEFPIVFKHIIAFHHRSIPAHHLEEILFDLLEKNKSGLAAIEYFSQIKDYFKNHLQTIAMKAMQSKYYHFEFLQFLDALGVNFLLEDEKHSSVFSRTIEEDRKKLLLHILTKPLHLFSASQLYSALPKLICSMFQLNLAKTILETRNDVVLLLKISDLNHMLIATISEDDLNEEFIKLLIRLGAQPVQKINTEFLSPYEMALRKKAGKILNIFIEKSYKELTDQQLLVSIELLLKINCNYLKLIEGRSFTKEFHVQIRELLTKAIDAAVSCEQLSSLIKIIENLKLELHFMRHRNSFSFFNLQWKGEAVSQEWANMMRYAKNTLFSLAKKTPNLIFNDEIFKNLNTPTRNTQGHFGNLNKAEEYRKLTLKK